MLYISFFVILLFIPMVHPNAADAIFHRDSATCIGDSSDASDADPLSDDEWWDIHRTTFQICIFLFIPNVYFNAADAIHFNAADAILHRDSAKCIASCVFFPIAFFVRNFNNWKPARIFQMRRRLFLHRDGPECVASFFVHSMCISTPPTRSYIATAQRVLHLA